MKRVKLILKCLCIFVLTLGIFKSYDVISVQAETTNEFTSLNDAAIYLRSEMVKRNPSITLTVIGSELTITEINQIYQIAIEHTGVPYEGDYIKSNKKTSNYSYNYVSIDNVSSTRITYSFEWLSTYEMEQEVTTKVNEILNSLNLWDSTDYEKIKGIYDYICTYVHYDLDHDHEVDVENRDEYVHSTHSAVIGNLTVCQGFASMLYRMLLEVGVDARYINGISNGENHAWNIVKIDDLYYNVDPTYDRGLTVYYRYFLCTNYNFVNHDRVAEYETTEFIEQYPMSEVPYGVSATANGVLNNNISWYLESDGTLTISGTGSIPDYTGIDTPWANYTNAIKKIVVSEGITTIGSHAFIRCNYATSVELPSTLKVIRTYAFDNCRSLNAITLPEGLMTIETNAFSECSALTRIELPDTVISVGSSVFSTCGNLTYVRLSAGMTSIPDSMFFNMDKLQTVIIPDGITEIGDTAFCGSDGITSITIPKQITKIGVAAFSDCTKLQNIYVDTGNENFVSVEGILFSKDMETLVAYPAGKTGTAYTIPDGIKTIAYGAMGGIKSLVRVTFPTSLLRIEGSAFSDCIKLSSLTFPVNLEYIGAQAFHSCKNLKSITFLNPNTTFGWHAFANCLSLNDITLPSNLTRLEVGLFSGCSSLNMITIPENVGYIDSSALSWCTLLRTIHIKGELSSAHSDAFTKTNAKCIYIDSQTLLSKVTSSTAMSNLFLNVQTIVIKSSLTSIPSYIKNNYTFTSSIVYNGVEYTIYSKHSCKFDTSYAEIDMCNTCGVQRDKHQHKYDVEIVSPTCTTEGYNLYFCDCGYTFKGGYKDPLGHNMIIDERVEPTCTEAGLTEGSHCSRCDYKVEQEVIESLGHSYESVVTEPTCTSEGYTTHTCHCGHEYVDSYIDALGHNMIIDERVEPTCTEAGLTEGSHCSRCSYKVEQEVIEALGHSYESVVTEPTCTSEGFTTHTCHCGDEFVDSYVAALGHNMIIDERVEPTCTEAGLTEGSHCSRCDYKVEQEVIEALGHSYESVVTEPTCTSEGYTTHTCCCGDEFVDSYVAALGHNMIIDERVEPTCIDSGLTEGSHCSRCDYKVEQEVIEALGHSYGSVVTEPTCTTKGFTTHTCHCGDEFIDSYVAALGHNMIIDERVEPTCTETGLTEGSHCSRCDYKVEQEVIEALGHDMITDERVEPTCTESGLTEGSHCSRCDHKIAQEVIPTVEHAFNEWVNIELPTCTNNGKQSRTCHNCGISEERELEAVGHNFSEWQIVTEKTCKTDGEKIHKCSLCGLSETEVIPSDGHEESEWIIDLEATITLDGEKHKECIHCGEILTKEIIPAAEGGCRFTTVIMPVLFMSIGFVLLVLVRKQR